MGHMTNKKALSEGFSVRSQSPIDDRLVISTAADVATLGSSDPYRFYEGMRVWVMDTNTEYVWREVVGSEAGGLVTVDFTYPVSVEEAGVIYDGRVFNFFATGTVSVPATSTVAVFSAVVALTNNVIFPVLMGAIGTEIVSVALYDSANKDISNGVDIEIDDTGLTVNLESNVDLVGIQVKVSYVPL
jgi:hypothetical protein